MRSVCRLAVLGVVLSSAWAAQAQPYELFAIYAPLSESGRPIEVPLTQGSSLTLPDGSEHHRLDRIVARFKADALSATTVSAFSKFVFTASLGDKPFRTVPLEMSELAKNPTGEILVLPWQGDGQQDGLARVKVEVRSIYTPDFLCLQEQQLLARGARVKETPLSAVLEPGVKKKGEETSRTLLLADGGDTALLYSFCRLPGEKFLHEQVDWSAAVKRKDFRFPDTPETATPEDLEQRHKKVLVDRLAAQLNQFPSRFGLSTVATPDTLSKEEAAHYEGALLFVGDEYGVTILKASGSVRLTEETGGDVRPLAEQIDQASEVILALEPSLCLPLPPGELMQPPWLVELEVADGEAGEGGTQRISVDLLFRDRCTRALAVQWKDYLGQRVTLRILFRLPGREDLVIYRDAFDVHNLGLITIVPVASEIVSAALSSSPKDIESTSIIPISWALSVRGGKSNSYAVTFPFVLGVNTRSAPRLAEFVALAPSVSVIAGGENEAPHFAFGMGVNLARAFHFGYAWAPTAGGGQYVLLGVSIPELLPLLSGLGVGGGGAP